MIGGLLDAGDFLSRVLCGDDSVRRALERKRVAVLRGLDEEHHKERDD